MPKQKQNDVSARKHLSIRSLGMDALVDRWVGSMDVIMVWAWMHWSIDGLVAWTWHDADLSAEKALQTRMMDFFSETPDQLPWALVAISGATKQRAKQQE